MKHRKVENRSRRSLKTGITVCILLLHPGHGGAVELGDCEKALARCATTCLMGALSGPHIFLGCSSWCLWGYGWCTLYYDG